MTTPDPDPLTPAAIRSRSEYITTLAPHEAVRFLSELAGRYPEVFDEVRREAEAGPAPGPRMQA